MKFYDRSILFCVAIVAVGLWSYHASAALPITESFSYTDGSTLLSGSGGAWVQAFPNTGNTNNINIINGSLTGPPELKSSSANSIAITGGGTSSNSADRIPFGQTVTSSAANTVYYSFLLKVTETTGSNSTTGGFFFALNNSAGATTNNPTVGMGRLQARQHVGATSTNYDLGIFTDRSAVATDSFWTNSNATYSSGLNVGDTYFIVGAYNGGAANNAKLWINPDPTTFGSTSIPTPTTVDTTAGTQNSQLSAYVRQTVAPWLQLDELRIGTSWAAVTPTNALYWDIDGATTAGAGGATPTGNWTGANWSTDPNGGVASGSWTGGKGVFAAGTDATGTYTVTVDNTQTTSGLTFEEGSLTLANGTNGKLNLIGAGAELNVSAGATATADLEVAGSVGLTKAGAGSLAISSNANSYSGTTTINAGTLQLGNGLANGKLPTASAIVDNGTFAVNRSNTVEQGVDFSGAAITGTGGLTQAGGGTLRLTAGNTFSGTTRATAGTLLVAHSLALQNSIVELETANAGSIVFDNSVTSATVGALSGTTAPSNLALLNNSSNPLALTVGSNTGVYGGNISGGGSLTKDGTGSQSITGDNSYTGGTTINSGSLRFGQTISMPASGAVVAKNTGILTVNIGGTGEWTDDTNVLNNGSLASLIKGRGGRGTVDQVTWEDGSTLGVDTTISGSVTYNGVIGAFRTTGGGTTNAVGFQKRGTGTFTLNGADTFTGPISTAANGGTLIVNTPHLSAGSSMAIPLITIGGSSNLQIAADDVLNAGSVVTSSSAGRLQLQSFKQTIRSLTGTNGVVEVGTGTLTIADQAGDNYTWGQSGGAVLDALPGGIVRKTGAGILTLAGAAVPGGNIVNGFQGEFIMENGQLNLSNGSALGGQNQGGRLTVMGGVISRTNTPTSNYTYNVANVDLHSFDYDLGYDQPDRTSQFNANCLVNLKEDNVDITIRNTTPLSATTGRFVFLGDIRNIDPNPGRGDNPLAIRGITKKGTGVLQFSAATTYKGPTKIEAGALLLGATAATLGSPSEPTAILYLKGGAIATTATRSAGDAISNPVVVDGAGSTIAHISSTNGLSNVVMEFNSPSITGTSGSLTITNLNSGTGNTVFQPLFTGTGFSFGLPITISAATGSGSNLKSNELQSGNTTGTQTFSGPISGGGSYRRITAATGETVFSGHNTFAGTTTVDGGLLTVSGSTATFGGGDVTVNNGSAAISAGVANAIADTAKLTLLGGGAGGVADIGFISLAASINERVTALVLGGVTQPNGTYGAPGSPAANTLGMDDYFTGAGIITVGPAGLPGDFNSDGKVDAGDYVTWRKNQNTNNALANDNGLGTPIGTAHYNLWRANFGNPPGAGSGGGLNNGAVPEPAALSLLIGAVGSCLAMSSRALRRRKN